MKKGLFIIALLACMAVATPNSSVAQECVSPALEYYMTAALYNNCSEIAPGEFFLNPVDGMEWLMDIVDAAGNPLDSIAPGAPFYLLATWEGLWGAGYMPHLYIPGNYYGEPLSWKETWLAPPESPYNGSAEGAIGDLADIADRNPLTVAYPDAPNLVVKTPNFASAAGNNTLVVAQEQVFVGWWDGPWIEPDHEIITWTFGPFTLAEPEDFIFRILISPTYNDDLYVADYLVHVPVITACIDNDLDGFYQETAECAGPFDCNDQDPDINPAACDIKKDGIDQDCDGLDRTSGKQCPADGDEEPSLKEGPGKTCEDGLDNDADGYADCLDPDCFLKKVCQ